MLRDRRSPHSLDTSSSTVDFNTLMSDAGGWDDLAPFPAETPKPPVEGEAEAPAAPAMNVILPPPTRDAKTIRTFWY